MAVCSFFGHRDAHLAATTLSDLKAHLTMLIDKHSVAVFYCDFYGTFDNVCANLVRELQCDFPHIKLCAITPYILTSYNNRNQILRECSDELIYPDIEHVPYRFAIAKRNEWMVNQSAFVITLVNHSWGGAHSCYKKAVSLDKCCTNFGSLQKHT